jgi:hypothetical protein
VVLAINVMSGRKKLTLVKLKAQPAVVGYAVNYKPIL